MENAAKALLIAGGSLIAILLLSLLSYLFMRMNEGTSRIYDIMAETEINEFNQQFWNHNGIENSVQDVASVINLARDSTKKTKKVEVYIEGTLFADGASIEDLIKNNLDIVYECSVEVNTSTKLVNKVYFTKKQK